MTINHQVRLAARPVGLPKPTDWSHAEEPVGEPAAGNFLVKMLFISLDPAMRGWMNPGRSYMPPVGIGEVMRALAVGRVTASKHPTFAVGDYVSGPFGVQEYALGDESNDRFSSKCVWRRPHRNGHLYVQVASGNRGHSSPPVLKVEVVVEAI